MKVEPKQITTESISRSEQSGFAARRHPPGLAGIKSIADGNGWGDIVGWINLPVPAIDLLVGIFIINGIIIVI